MSETQQREMGTYTHSWTIEIWLVREYQVYFCTMFRGKIIYFITEVVIERTDETITKYSKMTSLQVA